MVHDETVKQYQGACKVATAENILIEHHFDTTYNHSNNYISQLVYRDIIFQNTQARV
jgi:hypothetical protein